MVGRRNPVVRDCLEGAPLEYRDDLVVFTPALMDWLAVQQARGVLSVVLARALGVKLVVLSRQEVLHRQAAQRMAVAERAGLTPVPPTRRTVRGLIWDDPVVAWVLRWRAEGVPVGCLAQVLGVVPETVRANIGEADEDTRLDVLMGEAAFIAAGRGRAEDVSAAELAAELTAERLAEAGYPVPSSDRAAADWQRVRAAHPARFDAVPPPRRVGRALDLSGWGGW